MTTLNKLPEITSEILSGLKADEPLKHRILLSAVKTQKPFSFHRSLVPLCALSTLVIAFCILIPHISGQDSISVPSAQIVSAGNRHSSSPVNLYGMIIRAANMNNGYSSVQSEYASDSFPVQETSSPEETEKPVV